MPTRLPPRMFGPVAMVLVLLALQAGCDGGSVIDDAGTKVSAWNSVSNQTIGDDVVYVSGVEGSTVILNYSMGDEIRPCLIGNLPIQQQRSIFATACPTKDDQIWKELPSGYDISVRVSCGTHELQPHSCSAFPRPVTDEQLVNIFANAGDPLAQMQLGISYAHSNPKDLSRATEWHSIAAASGFPQGHLHLSMLLEDGSDENRVAALAHAMLAERLDTSYKGLAKSSARVLIKRLNLTLSPAQRDRATALADAQNQSGAINER